MNIQLNVTDYFNGVIGEDCSKHGQIIGLLMPHVLSYYFPNLVLYSLDGVNGGSWRTHQKELQGGILLQADRSKAIEM